MINVFEVRETNKMIEESNLDVRTITMGISLLDCCDNNVDVVCEKIYRKITEKAANLVKVGEQIELDYGIPIVNKRISVTPIALVGGSCCKTPEDYVKIAKTLDRAAHTVGINFLGGYSALVSKGMTPADKLLIESIPQALAETELVCSSVNVGSTKTGIDMDAVKMLGETVKKTAELTKDNDSATGTSNNDAYQAIRTQINDISQKMNAIYEAMGDSSLSDEQKEAKQKEGARLEEEYDKVIKEGVQKNITNPVGVFLFKQTFYNNSTEENAALLEQIPANFQNDETIVKVKEQTEKQKKTAVGTKFIDFEMQTPEGKTVKLSDYAGKGKVVLVDFWASWCGPCRREMPNLVEAYAQYKGKNFEIVGVSLDQDAAAWKESIKKLNMTWPQMSDLKFWQSEGAQLYAVNSIPHTVLIDGDGTIIARGLHGEGLQAKLTEVVK